MTDREPTDNTQLLFDYMQRVRELKTELEKWRNWKPDDETLADLQEQARARDGSYTNGLCAQAAYIGGLEGRLRELKARVDMLEARERALKNLQAEIEPHALWLEPKVVMYKATPNLSSLADWVERFLTIMRSSDALAKLEDNQA